MPDDLLSHAPVIAVTDSIGSMSSRTPNSREWIVRRGHRTFEIAERVHGLANSNIYTMSQIADEQRLTEFISNWSKDTLIHKFTRWAAHEMFYSEIDGPYLPKMEILNDREYRNIRYLSVTDALLYHRIDHEVFEVPPPDGESVQVSKNIWEWHESNKVADACFDYFTSDLMLGPEYEELLNQIAEEVFHIVFVDRAIQYRLNGIVANMVAELDAETLEEEEPEVAQLFKEPGKLKRTHIPTWARRAVFYRDHGRCTRCRRDVSGLLNALPAVNFDHMVPLAHGGLNDVTNLQLLCIDCNSKKSDKHIGTSATYARWFKL